MHTHMARRNIVGAYVLHRLREECIDAQGNLIRGKQAAIAKATDFTSAHLTHVFKRLREGHGSGRGVGDDLAHALAEKWWRISYADLEQAAKVWAAQNPAPEEGTETPPRWRLDPGWSAVVVAAREEAQRRGLKIPDRYFAQAGDAVVPDRAPTPEGVVRLAELLWVTDPGG